MTKEQRTGQVLELFAKEDVAPTVMIAVEDIPWPGSGVYALALAGRVDLAANARMLARALRELGIVPIEADRAQAQLAAFGLCSGPPGAATDPIDRIFAEWSKAAVASGAKRFAPKMTKDRKGHISGRLRDGYTEQQCLDAVRGIWADEWWSEHRDTLDVSHAFSSGPRIERYAEAGARLRELDAASIAEAAPAPRVTLPVRRAT